MDLNSEVMDQSPPDGLRRRPSRARDGPDQATQRPLPPIPMPRPQAQAQTQMRTPPLTPPHRETSPTWSQQQSPSSPGGRQAASEGASTSSGEPDWVLFFCYILLYLEAGWLVMLLWRTFGRSWFG